jgi:hypothetical protein
MEHTHQVQKYALIHSAAGEILAHMDVISHCSEKDIEFHALHIEKAAMFIQFVEDIYIIPGTDSIEDTAIKEMWEFAQLPTKFNWSTAEKTPMWVTITAKLKEHQKKINGKFLSISPF